MHILWCIWSLHLLEWLNSDLLGLGKNDWDWCCIQCRLRSVLIILDLATGLKLSKLNEKCRICDLLLFHSVSELNNLYWILISNKYENMYEKAPYFLNQTLLLRFQMCNFCLKSSNQVRFPKTAFQGTFPILKPPFLGLVNSLTMFG